MFTKHTAVSALAAIALAAAGCGSDSDSGSDTLAKADLAKKANEICAKYNPQVKELGAPDLEDPAGAAEFGEKYNKLVADQRGELGELSPADDVKAEWDTVLADYDKTAEASKTLFAAVAEEDVEGVATASQELQTNGDASNASLDALGATTCGSKSS